MAEVTSKLLIVRVLRAALVALMVALVPCILLAALFARQHLVWVIGVFVGGLLLVRIAFQVFPCPRCGKPFFRAGTWAGPNMFTKRCVHCGLGGSEEESPSITGAN
jgi:hypothetical protein